MDPTYTYAELEKHVIEKYVFLRSRMTSKVIQTFDAMTEEVIRKTEEIFECKCCGKCCKEIQGISMNNVDVRRLSDYLEMSKIEFIDRYMAEFDGRRGRMAIEEVCEFRSGDGKCTVYLSRGIVLARSDAERADLFLDLGFEVMFSYRRT